jgi:hypothetical protein
VAALRERAQAALRERAQAVARAGMALSVMPGTKPTNKLVTTNNYQTVRWDVLGGGQVARIR